MKIAVVGSGGREHCILWRLSRDSDRHTLFAVPGNGGTQKIAQTVEAKIAGVSALHDTLRRLAPDLVVIGPEIPLAAGITDHLVKDGIACFGPTAAAARLESSKAFAKKLMHGSGIPTAEFEIFEDFNTLERYAKMTPYQNGWVVKADGLAAGKGAYVCSSLDDVLNQARALMVDGILGDAGRRVVLERKLAGREVSALYFCDGEQFAALPAAQDYKRAYDNDTGPNTGGMGSYCPASHLTDELRADVENRVVIPVMQTLANCGAPYAGVLYVGLMLTESGPQVIEFNCRFGDPETQVILPVWEGDFAGTLLACCEGRLSSASAATAFTERRAVCVVLAAEGYPDKYGKDIVLKDVPDSDCAVTFHAGTRRVSSQSLSSGGRVLNAVGLGKSIGDARVYAYELAERLLVPGLRCRSDIALGV